jgi:hypothetical protein
MSETNITRHVKQRAERSDYNRVKHQEVYNLRMSVKANGRHPSFTEIAEKLGINKRQRAHEMYWTFVKKNRKKFFVADGSDE